MPEPELPLEGEIIDNGLTKNDVKKVKTVVKKTAETSQKPKKRITKVVKKTTKVDVKKVNSDSEEEKPKDSEVALEMWKGYLEKGIVNDFSKVPTYVKLTWLQNIPEAYIKTRPLNGKVLCPYIPHEFAEKALNFAFNFHVSSEVIFKDGRDFKGGFECEVEVKFTFHDSESNRDIVKTVFAGHKAYTNAAITRADAYKSAASKAYTVVARQFGIASNVKGYNAKPDAPVQSFSEREDEAYAEATKEPASPKTPAKPPKPKDWMDD